MKFNLSDLLIAPIFVLLAVTIGYKRWEFYAILITMGAWGLRIYYEGLHFDDAVQEESE
jgi:hypothetical protein